MITTKNSHSLKEQLKLFGLNPQEWTLKGPFPCPQKSSARWQGLFINKDEPQFQILGLWKTSGSLELHAIG